MSVSLRHRLLLHLVPSIVGVWLLSAFAAAWQANREAHLVLDANLAQSAAVILSLIAHEMDEHRAADETAVGKAPKRWVTDMRAHLSEQTLETPLVFQVSSGDGSVSFQSPHAPATALSQGVTGYSSVDANGEGGWRVYTLNAPERGVVIRVGEPSEHRTRLLSWILWKLLVPLLVGVPLLTGFVWLSVGRGLGPLDQIARLVKARAPSHLKPLGIEAPPQDLAPLVSALDRLFARLEWTLEGERRFTADAAHELRTPLAGIRAQAQLARQSMGEPGCAHALDQLLIGVDRATRLTEQLLVLARLDSDTFDTPIAQLAAPADLSAAAREMAADLADQARAKDIDFGLVASGEAWVRIGAAGLDVMLRNLLDNAIRYTPSGGEVTVEVGSDARGVRLEVADSGPGIPVEHRRDALERFHRGRGVGTPGSGLGLSIVARIVELAGASIHLGQSASGGLSVVVEFPQMTQALALDG